MAISPPTLPPSPTTPEPAPPAKNHLKRNLIWFTSALILIGIIWFLLWVFYFQYYESTDDAYAKGNFVNLNAAVSGSVISFFADDTDLVTEGQLIVQLDRTNYQIIYERELASLASIALQVKQLYDTVKANTANRESKRVLWERARFDFQNREALIGSQAVSNEDYIHAKEDLNNAEQNLKQAEYQLKVAEDAAGNTSPENHPLIEQQKGNVRTAFYNLQHCSIYAPTTGYVAQRNVEVGQWVSPTTNLLAIIPKDYVWVDANFKETQLTYMRIGQPATVWFDLYGSSVKYQGKVLGIASGSGSVFSIIPPQNATGNWIKIVQRLPVRISLDPKVVKDYPIRLGISAEVSVDLTNQDLPLLAQHPPTEPISTTTVYNLDMSAVEKAIQTIIQDHLKQ